MNQASISRRASLTFPLTDSINCRATQSLPRWPDSSTNQERIGMVSAEQSDPHHQGQCDPTLAVQKVGRLALWL
ncbi:MAG: hypothetical protein WJ306_05345 [Ferrovum myxofaciens]